MPHLLQRPRVPRHGTYYPASRIDVKPGIIEHQLALGTACNRTKFLKERRSMMQQWADYLDKLKDGADVVTLKQRA